MVIWCVFFYPRLIPCRRGLTTQPLWLLRGEHVRSFPFAVGHEMSWINSWIHLWSPNLSVQYTSEYHGNLRGGGSLVTASFGRLWPQVLVACDRRNCYSVTFRGRRNIWSCWSFTSCGKRIIWWCWSVTFVGRRSIGWNLGRQPEHNVWWGVVLE